MCAPEPGSGTSLGNACVAGVFLLPALVGPCTLRAPGQPSQLSWLHDGARDASALLELRFVLKLLDKERRSHINDFNFDEAVGLSAGLNMPPKKSYATDYSYRTVCATISKKLLSGLIGAVAPVLLCKPTPFLDFHPIPFRGDATGLDQHYLPKRGAGTSVLELHKSTRARFAMPTRISPA